MTRKSLLSASTTKIQPRDVLYKESEFYGEFNFRDTILEQPNRYFVYIARINAAIRKPMDSTNRSARTLIPYISIGISGEKDKKDTWANIKEIPELPPFFNKHRPAFGCFVYGANPLTEQDEMKKNRGMAQAREILNARASFVQSSCTFLKYSEPPPESSANVRRQRLQNDNLLGSPTRPNLQAKRRARGIRYLR